MHIQKKYSEIIDIVQKTATKTRVKWDPSVLNLAGQSAIQLNNDNLAKVSKMVNQGCIIIGFSKSSVEPLIRNPDVNLENVHFFLLDKSDEKIIIDEDVASTTKIEDIYDIETLALKINQINDNF